MVLSTNVNYILLDIRCCPGSRSFALNFSCSHQRIRLAKLVGVYEISNWRGAEKEEKNLKGAGVRENRILQVSRREGGGRK